MPHRTFAEGPPPDAPGEDCADEPGFAEVGYPESDRDEKGSAGDIVRPVRALVPYPSNRSSMASLQAPHVAVLFRSDYKPFE